MTSSARRGAPGTPSSRGRGAQGLFLEELEPLQKGRGGVRQHRQGAKTLLCEKGGANLVSGVLGVLMEAKETQPWDSHKEAASHATAAQSGRAWLGRQCSRQHMRAEAGRRG